MILTTHYMEEADRLSDRIAIMDYGKIVALDTPSRLKETLEGDVITVRTKEAERLSSTIAKKISIEKTRVTEGELEITVRDGKTLLPRIVEIASTSNIYVESVSLREPNLEDVFLHYTGRAIRVESGDELHGLSAIRRRKIK
jgi:ABC-2 type transport system ATP-binding protein